MKSAEYIKRLIENAKIKINPEVKQAALKRLINELEQTKNINSAKLKPDTGRIFMNSRIMKLATAAIIIIIVSVGINHFSGPINFTSVAWGQIVKNIDDINYFHYYEIENREGSLPSIREGWYSNKKIKSISCSGSQGANQIIDDGKTVKYFDLHNNVTVLNSSDIQRFGNIYEVLTDGLFSAVYSQFEDKAPTLIGDDFLIFDFEPPADTDWIEKISVTVGRNSLTPIQIKTYYKTEQWYSINQLLIFDYEEPQKEAAFFEPPTEIKAPNGIGRVILGGEEVEIDIIDAPGIKKAIVRLHTKFDGPSEDLPIPYRDRYELIGQPMYFMEITFILDNGYVSNTAKDCPLWLDQGVKAALGNEEVWPDKIYRNIRYTPVLRATDKQDEFILELSCWLRTKQPEP
ncbi:MAG: hypothetical protein JW787_13580 [Sedimentisphaerales bacterium]|nr:hypothetical protein [Sedimentisphaerales bacterium]